LCVITRIKYEARTLTSDFLQGKNHFGKDNLSTFFAWNDKEKMFTSCEVLGVPQKTRSANVKMETLFSEVFEDELCLSYCDLLIKYIEASGKSERTIRRHGRLCTC
jgi:nicotinic acid mononucleotide adenylyltransferase